MIPQIIECKVIFPDGKMGDIDLLASAICFIGPYRSKTVQEKDGPEDKNSCAVSMTNGATMRINMGRAALKQKIKAYRGQ